MARVGDFDIAQQRYQEAETEYGHALELDDSVAEYHATLAEILRFRGKTDEADQEEARARELLAHPETGQDASNSAE